MTKDKANNNNRKKESRDLRTADMPDKLVGIHRQLLITRAGKTVPASTPPDLTNKLDEKYEVGERIAKGGMGDVHSVVDVNCQRSVAMKVIHGLDRKSPKRIFRFIREARITAQLEHPNIVPVYELSTDPEGNVFYTMKKVKGTTLEDILRELKKENPRVVANYPLSRLLTIFQGICNAMAFAHSKGVVHRDLKPSNIMVAKYGEVLVMDWGLAKVLDNASAVDTDLLDTDCKLKSKHPGQDKRESPSGGCKTLHGELMGTYGYMSPEQAKGRVADIDNRSDIFSLGVILYKILTLADPNTGRPPSDLINMLKNGEVPPPDSFHKTLRKEQMRLFGGVEITPPIHCPNHKVPSSLSAVTVKAMAVDPDDRYQTVMELQEEISRYQGGYATSAEDAGLVKLLNLLIKRHKLFTVGLTIFLILIVHFVLQNIQSEKRAINAAREAVKQRQWAERNKVLAEDASYKAELQYANGLISQGNSLSLLHRWANAKSVYLEAFDLFKKLNKPAFVPEYKLWEATRSLPPPLNTYVDRGRQPLCMDISRNGRLCIAGYQDGTLILWDLIKSVKKHTLSDLGDNVLISTVDMANAAPLILVGRFDGALSLYNLKTGEEIHSLRGHKQMVNKVLFSPDERTGVSGSEDGTVMVWNLETGERMNTFYGHLGSVETVAISNDGELIASGGIDHHVILWDRRLNEKIRVLSGHDHEIHTVEFSSDDQAIMSGDYSGLVKYWDRDSGSELHTFRQRYSPVVASMPLANGELAVTGQEDATISVWNMKSESLEQMFRCYWGNLVNLTFSHAGSCLSASADDQSLTLQPIVQREVVSFVGHKGPVESVRLSADGHLAVSSGWDRRILVWDIATGKLLRVFSGHRRMANCAIFLPNTYNVLSGGHDGILKLWDVSSEKEIFSFNGNHRAIKAMTITHQGDQALVGYRDGTVLLYNLRTGKVEKTVDTHERAIRTVAISPDDGLALIGNTSDKLILRNLKTDKTLKEFTVYGLRKAVFSPNGQFILCAQNNGSMTLITVDLGYQQRKLKSHGGEIKDVDFSPDGLHFVSASRDGSIRLWDIRSGRSFATLADHTKAVTSVQFSPDGKKLLSASKDKTLKLWDISRFLRYMEFEDKIQNARLALSEDPSEPKSLAILGEWYAFRGMWEWAVELLNETRGYGEQVSALTLARCYWEMGRLDLASVEFENALGSDEAPKQYLELCINAVARKN